MLKEFQHVDDYGADVGQNVREKAIDVSFLLLEEDRLHRLRGNGGDSNYDGSSLSRHVADPHASSSSPSLPIPQRSPTVGPAATTTDNTRRLRAEQREKETREIGKAVEASKEDEEKRQKMLRDMQGEEVLGDFSRIRAAATSPQRRRTPRIITSRRSHSTRSITAAHVRGTAAPDCSFSGSARSISPLVRRNAAPSSRSKVPRLPATASDGCLLAAGRLRTAASSSSGLVRCTGTSSASAAISSFFFACTSDPPATANREDQFLRRIFLLLQPEASSFSFLPPPPRTSLASSYPSSPSLAPSISPSVPSPGIPQTEAGKPRAHTTGAMDARYSGLSRLEGDMGNGMDTLGNVGGLRVPSGSVYASHTGARQ